MIRSETSESRGHIDGVTPIQKIDRMAPVDAFFRKEGETLRAHLQPLAEFPHIQSLTNMLVDQIAHVSHRAQNLADRVEKHVKRVNLIYKTANEVPELGTLRSQTVEENFRRNIRMFADEYVRLLETIIAYDLNLRHESEPDSGDDSIHTRKQVAANSLNTSLSPSATSDVDRLRTYRTVYSPQQAHLVYWDLALTTDILVQERNDTVMMEELKQSFREQKSQITDPAARSDLGKKISALNHVLQELPHQHVSAHAFEQFHGLMREFIETRTRLIFPEPATSRIA